MAAMQAPPAGWFPDPVGRFAQRYWDGSVWTEFVADAAGVQATDPLPTAPVGSAPAADETGELMHRLETAMADYGRLLEEDGPQMSDGDFARRAMKIGLIVRDTDAWLLDLPSGRWFHYNGFRLSPLDGWASRPEKE